MAAIAAVLANVVNNLPPRSCCSTCSALVPALAASVLALWLVL
jgi:hypothetical protein